MKQTLLLFAFWFSLSGFRAQVKPPADGSTIKLKRSAEIVRIPEVEEKSVTVYPNPTTGVVNLSLAGFNGKKNYTIGGKRNWYGSVPRTFTRGRWPLS